MFFLVIRNSSNKRRVGGAALINFFVPDAALIRGKRLIEGGAYSSKYRMCESSTCFKFCVDNLFANQLNFTTVTVVNSLLRLANSLNWFNRWQETGSQLVAQSMQVFTPGSIQPKNRANKSKNSISVYYLTSEQTGSIGELLFLDLLFSVYARAPWSTPDLAHVSKLDWSQ